MQNKTLNNHLVYITDEAGMASVFPELAQALAAESLTAVTILYQSNSTHFVFARELNILERHFPARLCVLYESTAVADSDTSYQRAIEAIINANTIPTIRFILSGRCSFIEQSKAVLQFLGANTIIVHEQFFTGM
jgi:hypothetical protein